MFPFFPRKDKYTTILGSLRARRWRLAGAERGSCFLQFAPNRRGKRVRTAKHASRDSFRVPERIHGLAEIIEGGAVGVEERRRVIPPHPERGFIRLPENASCCG